MCNIHTVESFHPKSIDNAYQRLEHIGSEVFEDLEFLIHLGGKIITTTINSLQSIYNLVVSALWAIKRNGAILNHAPMTMFYK
jgi:hypothetical protein